MLKIAYSPIYKYRLPPGHRFPMIKYELIPEQLLREGTISNDSFFEPAALSRDQLQLVHTDEYLAKLDALELDRKEARNIGFPIREDLIVRGKHIARGTYDCAMWAIKEGVSLNIAGGTHHAFADHGEGFCVFNDMALASALLLEEEKVSKIMIVDLDVHQGNGTAHIFQDDSRVFTFSMHGEKNYPLRKQESDLDISLPDGTDDFNYLSQLRSILPIIIEDYQPELIFYLAGVDVLKSDKLGRLSLSREGCKARDAFVFETCRSYGIPVAVAMGGGYSHRISDIIEAHANTFRLAQELYF